MKTVPSSLNIAAQWQPIDTAPRDETEVLIKTNIGVVSAWFHAEPGECYQWVCYDDKFTIDGDCGSVTHWMPIPSLPQLPRGKMAKSGMKPELPAEIPPAPLPLDAGSGSSVRIVDARCSCCMWSGRTPATDLECPECKEDLIVDDRADDDWCKANGWDNQQDCPECNGSGQYDDCLPCPYCDGDGTIDW